MYGKKINGYYDTYTIDSSKAYIVACSLNRGSDLIQTNTYIVQNGSVSTIYDSGNVYVNVALSGTTLTITNTTDSSQGNLLVSYNVVQLN